MQKERILSGIRATSKLHIGNYLGALKQFVDIQNESEGECFFFIADLHALTTPFVPADLRKTTIEVAAEYIAAGLNPDKSTIFLQNQVHEHSELAWIFECITPLGELERMTQYKDKAGYKYQVVDANKEEVEKLKTINPLSLEYNPTRAELERFEQRFNKTSDKIYKNITSSNAGLLAYPVLMAADILLYKPSTVPVGDDQTQHLELTRTIARKFNKQFGKTFIEPKNYNLTPERIMSLTEPLRKMSKSEPKGCLYLDDAPDVIRSKIRKAQASTEGLYSIGITNTKNLVYSYQEGLDIEPNKFAPFRGGINLFWLLNRLDNNKASNILQTNNYRYSEVKDILAETLIEKLSDFREKKADLLAKPDKLAQILGDGAHKARKVAKETLAEVKERVGLL